MKDYSVEYAHIYTNSELGKEHEDSIKILADLKKEKPCARLSLVVMVDDYSFPDSTFSYSDFSIWLEEQGYKPDLVIRESQLIPVCDEVLERMNNQTLQDQITAYIQSKKYPCSLFIAAWYLLRLGKVENDMYPKELVAKSLINILPKSFEPFEEKGFEIIASTGLISLGSIENRYFEGRLIA